MQHIRNERWQMLQLGIRARSLHYAGNIAQLILNLHELVVCIQPMAEQFKRLDPINQRKRTVVHIRKQLISLRITPEAKLRVGIGDELWGMC